MKYLTRLIFLVCFLTALQVTFCFAKATKLDPEILILNSYHRGYLWSDGEVNGIQSSIFQALPQARITVEYLDTKRIPPEKSFDNLFDLYQSKYKNKNFDLILSVDDNALSFLKKFGRRLFGETPIVFCGVNYFKPSKTQGINQVTGVTEIHRIKDNFNLLLDLHPQLEKVVVVTDVTTSGQISLQEVKAATPSFTYRLEFEYLEGLPLPQLQQRLAGLGQDSVVFLLNYFRDTEGNYYNPETVMPEISEASSVPIYCFSEFYMNHGATGGLINEGYPHGALAGKMALNVLAGENISTMVVARGPMRPIFDYRELARFNLDVSLLPPGAQVLNIKEKDRKDILLLYSYEPEYSWTTNIYKGMKEVLDKRDDINEIFVEFMDTKRYSNPAYYYQLYELYKTKYSHRQIDALLVADDNAFDFVEKFRNLLFRNTPVIFCGVNFLGEYATTNHPNVTGVVESLDIVGTIETILRIHPETEKILIINDTTTTGLKMKRDLEKNISRVQKLPRVEYVSQLPMKGLLKHLKRQDDKTVVLLLSFFRDGNNVSYPIKTSVRMITEECSRPVYGVTESVLNYGVVGGNFVLGRDQGRLAAGLATRVLDGESASDIPIVLEHPYHFIFDHNILEHFNIPETALPEESIILNPPTGFYYKYKRLVNFAIIVFLALITLIIAQQVRLRREERKKTEFETAARTDALTKTISRNFFVSEVEAQIANCSAENKMLTLCYCDINNLKSVNDTFGHREGDNYLITVVEIIQSTIRACDNIYRMGGDEFMIVFADCGTDQAKNRLRNIREKLDLLNKMPDSKYERGVSIGYAEFDPAKPKTLEQLLEETDELMYREKNGNGISGKT